MTYRQIVKLESVVDNDNLDFLDVSDSEIEVANLNSVSNWPALYDWGVNSSNTGFYERVSDGEFLTISNTDVSSWIDNSPLGDVAFNMVGSSLMLKQTSFDTDQSFAIAARVLGDFAIGSNDGSGNYWYLRSFEGKLKWDVSSSVNSGDYSNYTGPTLNSTEYKTVIFCFDRELKKIYIRVNGVEYLPSTLPDGLSLSKNLLVGGFWTGSSIFFQSSWYKDLVTLVGDFSESDIETIENMMYL